MSVIETSRLELIPMGASFLRASLAGDRIEAERTLGAELPGEWPQMSSVLRLRLAQLEQTPEVEPWLTRAIVLTQPRRAVGVTGFHGPPGGAWLRDFAPQGVEFGYTVFAGHRRCGYAEEASRGLMEWATDKHGVRSFILSMGPDNVASAALARRLGFEHVGEWVHEARGTEHVYRRVVSEES